MRFFSEGVRQISAPDRRARLDKKHKTLSVGRQLALMGLARSSVHRTARPIGDDDGSRMRQIDEVYADKPFYGSRRVAFELDVDRKRVQRLMRLATRWAGMHDFEHERRACNRPIRKCHHDPLSYERLQLSILNDKRMATAKRQC